MSKMLTCKICGNKTGLFYKGLLDTRHGYPGRFDIYRCMNCGFMQTRPQLSPRKLTQIYTNYYPKRDANIDGIVKGSSKIPSKKEIIRNGWETTCHFQTKKGQKVLDVGCGSCQSLLEIKKMGGEAWGIDPDKNSQSVAGKLKLKFHLGTIHDCKFPKKYFDLITASQVLEHEPDPVKFLKDSKKFLKNNGKIVMSFPNTDSLFEKIWGRSWIHWHIPYHLNHFNRKSLALLAKKSGMEISGIKTVTPNIWTVLQIRSFFLKTKEGERNAMWDEPKKTKTSKSKPGKNIARSLYLTLIMLLTINRVFDRFGQGESFVVELKSL